MANIDSKNSGHDENSFEEQYSFYEGNFGKNLGSSGSSR